MILENPIISIIIPVFNVEKYLHECLDSVINQTLQDIEIICVNDKSTDSSSQILESYAQQDNRVKIINKDKNEGTLLARKTAVLQAKGKYVVFVDSDDMLHSSDVLTKLYQMIQAEDVDILQFSINLLFPDGTTQLGDGWFQLYEKKLSNNYEIISSCIANQYNWCLWSKIYKTEVCIKAFQEVKDIYLITAEDCYTYFLIAYYAQSFIGKATSSPLYNYRQGAGITSTENLDLTRFEMFCKENLITNYLEEFLQKHNDLDNYIVVLNNLSQRFLSNCFWRLEQIYEEEKDTAFHMIFQYFSPKEIYYFMNQELVKERGIHAEILENERQQYADLLQQERSTHAKELAAERKQHADLLQQELITHANELAAERRQHADLLKQERIAHADELATERKQNADFRKNISQFNIGRYLRTKILSRMTFGDVRKQLSTQYKQQKRIYGMIKNRNSS